MNNLEIRLAICKAGLFHYQVAEALGMHETSFTRKLRKELPDDEKTKILEVIDRLSKGEI